MTQDYNAIAQSWLNGDFDHATKCQILDLRNNDPAGFEDAFYRNLEFGTGGLRGIMGVGTNRMNKYTVGMATQGLANYLKSRVGGDLKVCVSFDSRNNSKEFAKITADVLSANGIHVYLYDNIHAVPLLSYAVRAKKANAGVMITASHNPKEYNGYKVFWSDGAQVTSPVDKEIVAEVSPTFEAEGDVMPYGDTAARRNVEYADPVPFVGVAAASTTICSANSAAESVAPSTVNLPFEKYLV